MESFRFLIQRSIKKLSNPKPKNLSNAINKLDVDGEKLVNPSKSKTIKYSK